MEARIRRNIIILIVLTFLLLVGMSAGWFFVLVRPQKEAIEKTTISFQGYKTKAEKLGENQQRKQKAIDRLEYVQEQIQFFQNRYRSFDFGDLNDPVKGPIERNRTWLRLMREYNSEFGIALREQLVRAANVSPRVLINTSVSVIEPPDIPEQVVVPANGLLKPANTLNVTVKGSFQSILAFFNRINEVSPENKRTILLSVSNVKLDGVSPDITATFTVTPYMIGRGKAVDFKGATPAAPPAPAAPAPGTNPGPAPPADDGAKEEPIEKE